MNKSIISVFLRSIASRASSGIRGRLKISKSTSNNADFDDIDDTEDDLDSNEGDFMNVDKAYDMYEREGKTQNEMLKRRIVMSQFFNTEVEPSFLTFMEKRQIRALHASDPKEWTVNKLSDSFPVLPHVVKKILKSKWQPSSTNQILKYDKNVMENWKNFRAGKLAVSYPLKIHLMKFKGRKISTMGRQELAVQFVPPTFQIPKPKSKIFISIAEGCADNSKFTKTNRQLLGDGNAASKNATENCNVELNVQKDQSFQFFAIEKIKRMEHWNKYGNKLRPMKFNEFIEEKLDRLYYESPTKTAELLQKCREYEQGSAIHEIVSETLVHCADNKSTALTKAPVPNSLTVLDTRNFIQNDAYESETSINTFVKARNKKITEDDYTMKIKIPKHLHQEGMTYRIKDCYYDDDGEFLYRIIGM